MASVLARVLGALILLALAALSGVAGWTQWLARTDPDRVLEIDPGQAEALLTLAERDRLSDNGSPEVAALLGARLLRREPLRDAPLVYAGLSLAAAGQAAPARYAFRLALKRQPRNVPALSWLAIDALDQHDYETAVGYLERLVQLDPSGRNTYADQMASIAADERGVALLEARLRDSQPLAREALARLNRTSEDFEMLLRLNAQTPAEQAGFLRRLVEEQGASAAFIAWLELAPHNETLDFTWPFDPVFVGSMAPPPFNWSLHQGAELLQQGGLFARYTGRGTPVFAEQLMMLAPGAYRFSVEMDGDSTATGGGFEWTLACEPSRAQLGAVPVQGLGPSLSAHIFDFVVPAGAECLAQSLQLRGHPGAMPDKARGAARRVLIQPAGGAH